MEVYLYAFVNFKQNNQARLLLIAKFAYNNTKNASTNHIPFDINCGYYLFVYYEKKIDPHFKSKSTDELSIEL